jgi:2,4-dienoyl-CoA reductase-like NADH-dependent reductase (Old Yellow Enzyme family)
MGSINTGLTLASGLRLPNRLVKAAMTEGLADARNHVTQRHITLYQRWADGGAGTQITGNVQIDRNHLEQAGNVVIGPDGGKAQADLLARWAEAGKSAGGAMIMQVSHAGRQTPKLLNPRPAAPSAVKLGIPGGQFGAPRAMTRDEIAAVIEGFGRASAAAKKAGFDGVQVHAAHGYLLSSFLSPLANRREDEWGGPLDNRARLLIACVRESKIAGGPGFSVSVKLNSADFQKGGFSHEDCLGVVDRLAPLGIDFLEISGGNYEQPRMMDMDGMKPAHVERVAASTAAREAYFLDYAASVRQRAAMPLMVTGGFRARDAMNAALAAGDCALIGMARPFCADPDAPKKLLSSASAEAVRWERQLRLGPGLLGPASPIAAIKAINGFGSMAWYYEQIKRLADGEAPDTRLGLIKALGAYNGGQKRLAKAWRARA